MRKYEFTGFPKTEKERGHQVKQEGCHAWLADMDQEVGGHELV